MMFINSLCNSCINLILSASSTKCDQLKFIHPRQYDCEHYKRYKKINEIHICPLSSCSKCNRLTDEDDKDRSNCHHRQPHKFTEFCRGEFPECITLKQYEKMKISKKSFLFNSR
jgi:hypothetical protein